MAPILGLNLHPTQEFKEVLVYTARPISPGMDCTTKRVIVLARQMQLSHPIKDLTLEDGKLMRGVTGGRLVPYMDTPTVKVTGVGTASKVDKDNLVKYPLNLNVEPDDVWTQLLTKRKQGFLTHLPGKTLTISCTQGALQEEYDTLKAAIEEANRAYEQEKKEVMTLVENDQQAKAKAVNIALERHAQIQKELDNLQL